MTRSSGGFTDEQCVLVSETFRAPLSCGGRRHPSAPFARRYRDVPIAGVFFDYTRDQGTVFLSQKNFRKFWHDDRVQ